MPLAKTVKVLAENQFDLSLQNASALRGTKQNTGSIAAHKWKMQYWVDASLAGGEEVVDVETYVSMHPNCRASILKARLDQTAHPLSLLLGLPAVRRVLNDEFITCIKMENGPWTWFSRTPPATPGLRFSFETTDGKTFHTNVFYASGKRDLLQSGASIFKVLGQDKATIVWSID